MIKNKTAIKVAFLLDIFRPPQPLKPVRFRARANIANGLLEAINTQIDRHKVGICTKITALHAVHAVR